MTYSIDVTDEMLFTDLRAWLLHAFSGVEVVQGLINGVPMPKGAFINMVPAGQLRLATNTKTYAPSAGVNAAELSQQSIQKTIQLDFYGPISGDQAAIVSTLWRDDSGCAFFSLLPSHLQPLYNSDPLQMPLIDGEYLYEQRWLIKVVLQYNPVVTSDQEFFTGVSVLLKEVDAVYPP